MSKLKFFSLMFLVSLNVLATDFSLIKKREFGSDHYTNMAKNDDYIVTVSDSSLIDVFSLKDEKVTLLGQFDPLKIENGAHGCVYYDVIAHNDHFVVSCTKDDILKFITFSWDGVELTVIDEVIFDNFNLFEIPSNIIANGDHFYLLHSTWPSGSGKNSTLFSSHVSPSGQFVSSSALVVDASIRIESFDRPRPVIQDNTFYFMTSDVLSLEGQYTDNIVVGLKFNVLADQTVEFDSKFSQILPNLNLYRTKRGGRFVTVDQPFYVKGYVYVVEAILHDDYLLSRNEVSRLKNTHEVNVYSLKNGVLSLIEEYPIDEPYLDSAKFIDNRLMLLGDDTLYTLDIQADGRLKEKEKETLNVVHSGWFHLDNDGFYSTNINGLNYFDFASNSVLSSDSFIANYSYISQITLTDTEITLDNGYKTTTVSRIDEHLIAESNTTETSTRKNLTTLQHGYVTAEKNWLYIYASDNTLVYSNEYFDELNNEAYVERAVYYDGALFISFTNTRELLVLDVTDLTQIVKLTSITTFNSHFNPLYIYQHYLFIADLDYLKIYDVSEPSNPIKVNDIYVKNINNGVMHVYKNYLIAVANNAYLFDLSDINDIKQIQVMKDVSSNGISDALDKSLVTIKSATIGHFFELQLNFAPEASDQYYTLEEDGNLIVNLAVTDPENDTFTLTLLNLPQHSDITINSDARIHVKPNPDYNGNETLKVRATDQYGNFRDFNVHLTVNPVNDPPTLTETVSLAVQVSGVATEQLPVSDIDSKQLTYNVIDQGTLGTVEISNQGLLTYTSTGLVGSETIVIEVSDGEALPLQVPISINVIEEPKVITPAVTEQSASGGGSMSYLLLALSFLLTYRKITSVKYRFYKFAYKRLVIGT